MTASTLTRDRIVEFLKQGIPTGQIADSVGVDPSYVSQVKGEPAVAEAVATARAAELTQSVEHDKMLEDAEIAALKAIKSKIHMVPFAQQLQAFRTLNGATRRGPGPGNTPVSTETAITVTLVLPETLLPSFVRNERNEIIEVEGKVMQTASPKSLDKILEERASLAGVPGMTALPAGPAIQRAAEMLQRLETPILPPRPKKHRLPSVLSPDVL